MEEAVSDAYQGNYDDPVLSLIVEIAVRSIRSERPLFKDLLQEPIFYARYIFPWVNSAINQEDVFSNIHKEALRF